MSNLCCCEYVDDHGNRPHLAEMCCNCVEMDNACERCNMPFCDRLGARKLLPPFELISELITPRITLLSFLLFPILTIVATNGIIVNILVFILIFSILFRQYKNHLKCLRENEQIKYPNFFLTWFISSFLWVYLVFECEAVPFLDITNLENLVCIIFLLGGLFVLYLVKIQHEWMKVGSVIAKYGGPVCPLCKFHLASRQCSHSMWMNICILDSYQKYCKLGMIMVAIGIFYGCNLTLTTVCSSLYLFGNNFLVPYSCSDVYYESRMAVCFVCAIYSFGFFVYIACVLILRRFNSPLNKYFRVINGLDESSMAKVIV